jgi:hypothetical protein
LAIGGNQQQQLDWAGAPLAFNITPGQADTATSASSITIIAFASNLILVL